MSRLDLKKFCHPKQFAFVADPAPYATAVTSRRAGKTVACAADLIATAIDYPGSVGLYITLSRTNAKILLWPILKEINEKEKLGGEPNEADLTMKYGSSHIYLSGVKDISEINKFRGMAIKKVYLDEAQSMRPYIKELIDDVLDPALIDHNGKMRVIGTPGPVPVGYFHDVAKSDQWSHHDFTIWDNPFIKEPAERLELVLRRRGIDVTHPSIQREWFGRWVLDLNSLVIQYNAEKADYQALPGNIPWEHILAVDFGFEDADALACIGFSEATPEAYLIEEKITKKQGVTELAGQILDWIDRYQPLKIVGDFGALGKKIGEELKRRYSIPIEAADKVRKFEYIELLNDALRTGRFKARADSLFAQDAMLLEWEIDPEKQVKVISNRFHSDIIDAVLYGFRESLHYLYEPKPEKPKLGTEEYFHAQEKEHIERLENQLAQEKAEERFWQDPYQGY